jgi:hypothetical protein
LIPTDECEQHFPVPQRNAYNTTPPAVVASVSPQSSRETRYRSSWRSGAAQLPAGHGMAQLAAGT